MGVPSGHVTVGRAVGLAVGLLAVLSACGTSSGSSGAAAPSSAATLSAGGGSSTRGPVIGPTTRPASPASPAASGTRRCAAADLAVALTRGGSAGTSQQTVDLTFTNRSATRCSVYGYPGAELRSASGDPYDIIRSPLVPRTTVVLAPGAAAHAKLTYLPAANGATPVFTPTSLVVIAPDQRTPVTLAWKRGPIVRQDGATHPGTYISALAPGA